MYFSQPFWQQNLVSTPPIGGGSHVTKADLEVYSGHVAYLYSDVARVNAALQERNGTRAML